MSINLKTYTKISQESMLFDLDLCSKSTQHIPKMPYMTTLMGEQ